MKNDSTKDVNTMLNVNDDAIIDARATIDAAYDAAYAAYTAAK